MSWAKNYKSLMRSLGQEPYGCLVEGCSHIARNTFGMILHGRFGTHVP